MKNVKFENLQNSPIFGVFRKNRRNIQKTDTTDTAQQMKFFVFYLSKRCPHFCTVKERLIQSLIRNLMFKHSLTLFLMILFATGVAGQG
ncbi:MAG: hypothetical protein KDC61_06365, partial [Saprospiraceae bacterium]|nr:hypothetical protein [Saprospiraceae bacterium]